LICLYNSYQISRLREDPTIQRERSFRSGELSDGHISDDDDDDDDDSDSNLDSNSGSDSEDDLPPPKKLSKTLSKTPLKNDTKFPLKTPSKTPSKKGVKSLSKTQTIGPSTSKKIYASGVPEARHKPKGKKPSSSNEGAIASFLESSSLALTASVVESHRRVDLLERRSKDAAKSEKVKYAMQTVGNLEIPENIRAKAQVYLNKFFDDDD